MNSNTNKATFSRAEIIGYGETGWHVKLPDRTEMRGVKSLMGNIWHPKQWVTLGRQGLDWYIMGGASNAPNGKPPEFSP